jgi:steroid delta-isomerase
MDEATMKERTLEYARRMNAGDLDGLLDLFSDDIVFEDPVGGTPKIGKEQLRKHIAWSMACNTHETPGRPVTSMDGRWVVAPTTVEVRIPERIIFDIIGVVEIGPDDRTLRVQAFWGVANTRVGDDEGELTGLKRILTVVDRLRKMHTLREFADDETSKVL